MIRVAILGAGIGAQHLDAYRALPRQYRVVRVIDQDLGRIAALPDADTFAHDTAIATALADPQVDLVDICLPPHLHVPVTLDALASGKHVVCEKPLATSLADIDRLRAASMASGREIYPVFQYRWGPAHAQLRALIRAGLTGPPQVAAVETHWSRGADYYAVPWRGTWAGEQGGAVLGHAIHNHDLLCHFMGPVASVTAMTATRVNPIETEDCASISMKMENGALCTSSITLGAAFDRTRLRLVFRDLTATSGDAPYAPASQSWSFVARDPSGQSAVDEIVRNCPEEHSGFQGFFGAVADHLNGKPSQAVRLEDGAASVALVTAIYDAARRGVAVDLPLPHNHPLYKGWTP